MEEKGVKSDEIIPAVIKRDFATSCTLSSPRLPTAAYFKSCVARSTIASSLSLFYYRKALPIISKQFISFVNSNFPSSIISKTFLEDRETQQSIPKTMEDKRVDNFLVSYHKIWRRSTLQFTPSIIRERL